jgi:hypothetical protein
MRDQTSTCIALLLSVLAATASAQAPAVQQQPLPFSRSPGVLIDEPRADGVFWVRGDTYKARVDTSGVTFLPVFPHAKAHTPIRFLLEGGKAAPVRVGQTFHFKHSDVTEELWESRLQGMEQLFVLHRRPGAGDFVVNIGVTTDLEFRGYHHGLVFAAPGLGEVTYGEGVVFDARGERAVLVPSYDAVAPGQGRITLQVSAAFLAAATYPVTIDPFVSNFAVTTNTRSQTHPDVVREPMSGDFVVIYEETLHATDHDIFGQHFREDGTLVRQIVFDLTTDLCLDPKICAKDDGSSVLAVWDNDGNRKGIQARSHSLSLNVSDPVAQVTIDGALEDSRTPDVGGGTRFPVNNLGQVCVFVRRSSGVNFALRAVRLQSNGIPTGSEFLIDGSPGCDPRPDIAPTGGVPLHWAVVWQEHNAVCGNPDIWFAAVSLGGIVWPAFELEGNADDETIPRVFTAGSDSWVSWVQPTTSFGLDVDAVLMRRTASAFVQVGPKISLSAAETGAPRGANQHSAAIGFDGCRHAYAYMEDQRPFAACVSVANGAYLYSEGHVSLSPTTNNCGATAMAYVPTANSPVRYAIVWQENLGSHFDIRGAFYDGRRATGGVTVLQTGCGRTQTGIRPVGVPAIGHRFEVSLTGVAGVPALAIGHVASTPITLCSPIPSPCQLGVFPIVTTIFGTTFATNLPCDPFLVGARLGFQGIDVAAPFGCTASQIGVALRTTDTLAVTFQ